MEVYVRVPTVVLVKVFIMAVDALSGLFKSWTQMFKKKKLRFTYSGIWKSVVYVIQLDLPCINEAFLWFYAYTQLSVALRVPMEVHVRVLIIVLVLMVTMETDARMVSTMFTSSY